MKMCAKLNFWLLVAILFLIEASGSKLSNLRSLDDDDSDDFEPELLDESEFWGAMQKFNRDRSYRDADDVDVRGADNVDGHDADELNEPNAVDEKFNKIDNLEWMNSAEADTEIEQLQSIEVAANKTLFTFGKRVYGDFKLSTIMQTRTNFISADIKANVTYPMVGDVGKNLTYITIEMDQQSNARARITGGGIGKRFVSISLEAYKTLYMHCTTTLYGK
ncbi:hypothetical protein Bhyg_12453 [Pseudolycoriella hygida]|uniref:Uncharacterized protein n=1 Tax=Pseudolycoriella hygida TaxID=35572 RepID=A0A9Q0S0W0_9DIPT|nr:hypothetical protein Bhyg_12453 [Pseudolycoriella hygida]